MGYLDEKEENEAEKEGISTLAQALEEKVDLTAEKERRKEEKRLEKERKKKEKEAKKRGEAPEEDSELQSRITPEESAEETKEETPTDAEVLAAESENEKPKKKRRKKKGKDQEKPEDVNIVKDLLSLIIYIGIVILACFLIVTYVGRRTTVHGSSMEPTLQSGDSLWINMLSYKFGDPERYDIIVFPYQDDVHYIKRIIGLPGETVQITDNGDILINGKILEEPIQFERIRDNGIASSEITLGENEYFVLGDNRNNSRDSRWADVGLIKRDKIIGKAVFRLTPFKNFGSIK